ncbi:MAG: UDP-N-acetylmuramate--L-alanine ligase [Firmicutes bacterium]|jgi:UDP-N-acetylmuramate--alanine ligase|nr:UDP-N-acetylmuramate--L-alanine ligase [Bacillota bacterium]
MIDFKKNIKNIHMIGIGGIGVSGLAKILMDNGFKVSGSDIKKSFLTEELKEMGATIFIGHDEKNAQDADVVVYTSAVSEENPELKYARDNNILTYDRAEMLGKIAQDYKTTIAIAGTHGKTTTTSMLAQVMETSELDPTILIGGVLEFIKGNTKIGSNKFLLTEACEYKRNFLKIHPDIAVILNVDEDHLDYYENIEEIIGAFEDYVKSVPKKGLVIINKDDHNSRRLIPHVPSQLITIGITMDGDYMGKNITFNEFGYPQFDVYKGEELITTIKLGVPGQHNIYNALCCIATAHHLGADVEKMAEALSSFIGAKRRQDIKGKMDDVLIIDDYAHHPTEIKSTLNAVSKMPHNKIWTIFQPHTYTRTKELLHEFGSAFNESDFIIVTDIYAAREDNVYNIHSKDLVDIIQKESKNAIYISDFKDIISYIKENTSQEDIVITMGAGSITSLSEMLIK